MTFSIIPRALILFLASAPVLALSDAALAQDFLTLIAAIVLLLALSAPQKPLSESLQLLKRLWLVMLFPVVWMLLQSAPIHADAISNAIWPLASRTLNDRIAGHISVDPGNTMRGLMLYIGVAAIFVVTIIVARIRHNADRLMSTAAFVTSVMSLQTLLGKLWGNAGIFPAPGSGAASVFVAMSAFGVAVNAAAMVRTIERRTTSSDRQPVGRHLLHILLSLAGIAINTAPLLLLATRNIVIVTFLGTAIILLVAMIRRLSLRSWLLMALLAIFAVTTGGLIVALAEYNTTSTLLRFATAATEPSITVAQRGLSDSDYWMGTGVGTYDALVSIYRDINAPRDILPPSSVLAISIEWGKLPLIISVATAFYIFAILFIGALQRGRDSCFSALAAACLLIAFCQAFCDPSLMFGTVQITLAILVGLGLAQTIGQSSAR